MGLYCATRVKKHSSTCHPIPPIPYLRAPAEPSSQGEMEGIVLCKDPLIKPATSYQKKYFELRFNHN